MSAPQDEITDRTGLGVLGLQECLELLRSVPIGRVAFISDGDPLILPVTFAVTGLQIAFRTSDRARIFAARGDLPVAFEADSYDETTRTGWSVLVRGVAEHVYDEDRIAWLDGLGVRPWASPDARREWVVVRADEITGRRIA